MLTFSWFQHVSHSFNVFIFFVGLVGSNMFHIRLTLHMFGRYWNGCNPTYVYINEQLAKAEQEVGKIPQAERKRLRRQYALAYADLPQRAKDGYTQVYKTLREEAQKARKKRENELDVADRQALQQNLNALDPRTHFGRGTYRCPVSNAAWEATLAQNVGGRGGIRRASELVWPELDLICRPVRKRLVLPKGGQEVLPPHALRFLPGAGHRAQSPI